MTGNGAVKPDPIADAVAATRGDGAIKPVAITVTLSSGRPAGVMVPADLSTREALDLVSFVADGLGAELERQRRPRPSLVVAGSIPQNIAAAVGAAMKSPRRR